MNLEQSRKAIDEIDQQLVKLFTERMACAAEIAAYKKENNLPVLDAGRERQKLAAISGLRKAVPGAEYSVVLELRGRLLGNRKGPLSVRHYSARKQHGGLRQQGL